MRVLFAVIPERGHLNPCIGVAQHLVDLGATVAFVSPGPIGPAVAAAGFDLFFGPDEEAGNSATSASRGAVFANQVTDAAWLSQWIEELLIERADDSVELALNAIDSFDPDVVVVDPMLYGAIFAAHRRGRPWVSLSNSLNPVLDARIESDLLSTVERLAPARDALFARHGLVDTRFSGCDALSDTLNIAFSTPALTGREVAGIAQVGPARTPRPRGDNAMSAMPILDDRPLLYCSFGSQIFHQPERFALIIEACAGRDLQVVLALQDLCGVAPFARLPDNVHGVGYAQQWQLLEQADAVITHGGANTVMEAMATGTAMLIDPICNDQFHQAWFVEQAGVGRRVDIVDHSAESLWAEIDWALQLEVTTASATYDVDGSRRAAELILDV